MTPRRILFAVLVIALCFGALPLSAQDDGVTMTMWVRNIGDQVQELVDAWNDRGGSQIH